MRRHVVAAPRSLPLRLLAAALVLAPGAAAETFPLFPEKDPPPALKSLAPVPTEKRFGLAAAEAVGLELLPWAFDRYVLQRDYAVISWNSVKYNYQTGFAYDRDVFKTNQTFHPVHGSLFFNAGRSNGFTFWESAPFALFGSLIWEMNLESEPPPINDVVNTTLGGMTLGEVEHRLSVLVWDNTKSGPERFVREAAGFVLNPVGGITRLIKGQMWTDFQNPSDRFPGRLYLELDGMYRHRSGSAVGDVDNDQAVLSFLLRYGDLFEGDHAKPFDYFDAAMDLSHPASVFVTRAESRGLLTDWRLTEGGQAGQRLGLFLHFDYHDNLPIIYGAQAFSADHLMRIPLTPETDLRTDLALNGMPMAAVQVDYHKISEELTGVGRSYDYGPGGGTRATVQVRRRGMDLLTIDYWLFLQHASNGIARNSRLQAFTAEGRFPVAKTLAVGAGWTWGERLSTYDGLPTVGVSGTSWRAFAAWRRQEVYASASGAGPVPETVSADPKGRWEVTAFGGGFFGSRVLTSPALNVMTATAPVFGARVGYGLTRVFSLEAGWSRSSTRLEPQNPETGEPAGPDSNLRMNAYEVNGLFGIGSGPIRGYLGLGAGVMDLDPNVPTLQDAGTSNFAANLAVGGKLFLTDAFGVRVDGRYRWRAGENRLATTVCNSKGCHPFDTNIYSSIELTGGLTLRF